MSYRLLLFKFEFIDDGYLFPIIINNDDFIKAKKEYNLVSEILTKLNELPGLKKIVKLFEKVDTFVNLQSELNSIIGEITPENIKTIDIEIRKPVKIDIENISKGVFKRFLINIIHLPIKKLDNFNDIDINPFIIVEID